MAKKQDKSNSGLFVMLPIELLKELRVRAAMDNIALKDLVRQVLLRGLAPKIGVK